MPDQPTVHSAEQSLAGFCFLAHAPNVIENPADLAAGKVSVDDQTRFARDGVRVRRTCKLRAKFRRAPALPVDRRSQRHARPPVPDNYRLPLIRDADCGDFLRLHAAARQKGFHRIELPLQDLRGVLFYPARLWVPAIDRLRFHSQPPSFFVVQGSAGTRCPLIQSEQISHRGKDTT